MVWKLIHIALFALLLILPFTQQQLSIFPRVGINNVQIERKAPELSWNRLLGGRYQAELERWFMRTHGLWGTMVRLENQLNFSVFHQNSAKYTASVIAGKKPWLIQRHYIEDLNNQKPHTQARLVKVAQQTKELQDFLEERGKTLLVLVTSNKASYDPSIVPRLYRGPRFPSRSRDYERMKKLFLEKGIHFLDSRDYLKERESEFPYPLFSPSASHFNVLGNCLLAQGIIDKLEKLRKEAFRRFDCGPEVKVREKPRGPERDLTKMINLWYPEVTYAPTPYPKQEGRYDGSEPQPKVLIVGTSFLWGLMEIFERFAVYQQRFFYYYNRTNYFYYRHRTANKRRGKKALDQNIRHWEEKIFSNDIIILEANEAGIAELGSGLLDQFEKQVLGK